MRVKRFPVAVFERLRAITPYFGYHRDLDKLLIYIVYLIELLDEKGHDVK